MATRPHHRTKLGLSQIWGSILLLSLQKRIQRTSRRKFSRDHHVREPARNHISRSGSFVEQINACIHQESTLGTCRRLLFARRIQKFEWKKASERRAEVLKVSADQCYCFPRTMWGTGRIKFHAAVVRGNKHLNATDFGELWSEGTFSV